MLSSLLIPLPFSWRAYERFKEWAFFLKPDKNIKPSGDVINSFGSRTEDVFPRFKEQSFPLFRATPWKPLEQPWDSQPWDKRWCFCSMFSTSWCHSMVPFMDLGDKILLMFILVLSSALSTPWTQSWRLLPIFLLSFYWPVSSRSQLSSIQTPPTWIIPRHPTLAQLQKWF